MKKTHKKNIEVLFDEFGVKTDAHDKKTINKLLDGWSSIRPVRVDTSVEPSGAISARFTVAAEHHYTKKIGGKSCNGRIGGRSCSESFAGVDKDFIDLNITRLDIGPSGVKLSNKSEAIDSVVVKEALETDEGYHKYSDSLGSILDIKNCEDAVETLSQSIYSTLESFGLIANSNINDKDKRDDFKSRLTTILADYEMQRRVNAFEEAKASINQDIIDVMEAAKLYDTKTINWLYAGGDAEKQTYRIQASQSYPLLLGVLMGHHLKQFRPTESYMPYHSLSRGSRSEELLAREEERRAKEQERRAKVVAFEEMHTHLLASIDERKPIADQLAACLNIDKVLSQRSLRSIGKVKEFPKNVDYNEFLEAIFYLDDLDSNLHPKTSEDFAAFLECVKRAQAFQKVFGIVPTDTLKKIKGKWIDWEEKTVSEQAILDIPDWRREITKMIILPQIIGRVSSEVLEIITDEQKFADVTGIGRDRGRGHRLDMMNMMIDHDFRNPVKREMDYLFNLNETEAVDAFFSQITPMEMLACSLRWHEQGEGYSAQKHALGISNLSDLDNWAALSKPIKTRQGPWVTPLTSKAQLNKEGKAMGHCVGWNGYDANCLTKNDHIVSVSKDGDKERLATVQLREVFNDAGKIVDLEIVQNQGPGNARADKAVKWYIKELFTNQAIQPDWESIEAIRSDNRNIAMKEGIAARIGFDPLIDGNGTRAYEAIRPFLPAKYRQVSLDQFLASSSSAEAIQIENTEFGKKLIEHGIIQIEPEEPEVVPEEPEVVPEVLEPSQAPITTKKNRGFWGSIFGP